MLTVAEINDYNKQGFIVKKDFFSLEEISQFSKKLTQIIEFFLKKNNLHSQEPLHDGFIQLDKINHTDIHTIYNIIRNSDALSCFVSSKKVFDIIGQLMSNDVDSPIYNMYHVSRMDPPQDERFLYKWHQESFYTIPNTKSIQLWAPLVEKSTKENGTIDVLIGSHIKEIQHRIEKVPNGHEQKYLDDIDIKHKFETLKVELSPRDAVFFHPYLIHKSNHNIGNKVRYSLVSHYLDPLSTDYDTDITDLSFAEYHRQRCINYEEYVSKTI
ncbi:MAG: hypothetical protein GQ474_04815 [Sulfurimonas sp.]|nr:hypothetical protein [Sulfurimonas sp.]